MRLLEERNQLRLMMGRLKNQKNKKEYRCETLMSKVEQTKMKL